MKINVEDREADLTVAKGCDKASDCSQAKRETEFIDVAVAAKRLSEKDNILILAHHYPDGDTLGSGYALFHILKKLGKTCRVECSHEIPKRYNIIIPREMDDFEPQFICAVDTADTILLGEKLSKYKDSVDLCIDHHPSNIGYAKETCLKGNYSAAAMIIYEIALELSVEIDQAIANCIYTGIATDTGCFRFSNTSAYSLKVAAALIELGASHIDINQLMFGTKTRERISLEKKVLESMSFHLNERCTIIFITQEMILLSGANENDLEGLTSLPIQVEDVWVGITFREEAKGTFKVSVRTAEGINASSICAALGGGGHFYAAGCIVSGTHEEVCEKLLDAVSNSVPEILSKDILTDDILLDEALQK